jgi:hypothetical protein
MRSRFGVVKRQGTDQGVRSSPTSVASRWFGQWKSRYGRALEIVAMGGDQNAVSIASTVRAPLLPVTASHGLLIALLSQNWDNREGATRPGCRREAAALGRVLQARFLELPRGRQGRHGKRPRHRAVRWNRAYSEAVEGARSGRAGDPSSRTTATRIGRCTRSGSRKPCTSYTRFQKKSPSGIRTAKRDVDLVAERLRTAEKDYEEHYGKPKR